MLKVLQQKGMARRTLAPGSALAKRVAMTTVSLTALRAALPLVIEAQVRLFGDAGRPGGSLLESLFKLMGMAIHQRLRRAQQCPQFVEIGGSPGR